MVGFDGVTCPYCDEPPTEQSVEEAERNEQLRSLGYVHSDYVLKCSNEHEWTHGVPRGTPEYADTWTCDACGGYYIPRDVFHSPDGRIHFIVKCADCYYKPNEALHFAIPDDMGEEWGILLGHPLVCGNTENADREQRVQLTLLNP